MSAGHAVDPRPLWREQAARLYAEGYFEQYSRRQKDEVLRKGYLGSWDPGRALEIARRQLKSGLVFLDLPRSGSSA